MPKRQSKQHLHPKINVLQLLFAIIDIEKRKCTTNHMVQDVCMIDNKWRQSTTFIWYDFPIHSKIMALTTLLWHIIRHDDNHKCKKCMNAQSTMWRWCHTFYKNPSISMKKVCVYIAIQKVRFTLARLKFQRGMLGPPVRTSFCARK